MDNGSGLGVWVWVRMPHHEFSSQFKCAIGEQGALRGGILGFAGENLSRAFVYRGEMTANSE